MACANVNYFSDRPAIAELGIPHSLIKDDEFEGYRLPAGTVVTWNHWAISHLESEYKDPTRFWPERFLNDELDKPTKGHLGFGAGKSSPLTGLF